MDSWVVGVDCHAATLTAVRVDAMGRAQGERTVPNTQAGHARLQRWAATARGARAWAVEGAGGHGRVVTRRLQEAGEAVYEIPGWMTARERQRSGRRDKSDAQDALAAARAWQREPGRATARGEDGATVLRLLADERDALVQERTRVRNQLRAGLQALGAEVSAAVGALGQPVGARRVLALPLADPDPVQRARRALAHRLAQRLLQLHAAVAERTQELTALVAQVGTSLTSRPGCQAITAARLLGETGDPAHFGTEARYARFCGVAPREASSGTRVRHRLDRRGNRQLNAALHRMVVTQTRMAGSQAQHYVARRMGEGKSRREAVRALKRHLARSIFRTIKRDLATGQTCFALT